MRDMEERELFAEYKRSGDVALRNEIVERYLYIAAMIAKKFVGRGVEYDDLYQVAALALMKGVDRFDENMGVKFSTFITPTITGELKNYFRDRSRLIHLPRRVAELRSSIRKEADEIFSETGKSPTAKQLAERLNVTEEEVVSAMEAGGVVSLDQPIDNGEREGSNFYEMIPADNSAFDEIEQRDALESAVRTLSDEERQLIAYRFQQELSQAETARRMNVSQMYVSRMERKILQKLRENLKKSMAD